MNLADVIRIHAATGGDRAAIRYDDTTLTYAEVWRATEALATQLVAAGVGAGDRVGLALKDHPKHLIAHYAIARLSAVILPIDHRWTEAEKSRAAATFGARLVVTDDEAIDAVQTLSLSDDDAVGSLPPIDLRDSQPLLISLSSGTTGNPKGAIVTHENLYERFVSQWVAIGFDARDCFALVTPLFFGAGRSFGMSLLAAGGRVRIAPPPLQPDEIVAVLSDGEVTATFLPPTLLRRLLPLAKDGPLLPHLEYLLVSGEPLYATEARECREKICRNLVGYYASSEGGGISILAPADFEKHAATVGRPTFRTDVEIVDDGDNPVGSGVVGRLRYRGPGVATQFLDADGEIQHSSAAGWFYPGDLAERLADGHIALRGRDKDVIIRGGVNVYPAEIEAVLQQHVSVRECAVIGCDDAERGQAITACLVVSGDVTDEALSAHCRTALAPYKVPARFVRYETLPKASSGKTDKRALVEKLAEPIG